MLTRNRVWLIVIFLVVFDVFVWGKIAFGGISKDAQIYFLDIGQGDSELVILPGGAKVLIDGGPDAKVITELGNILGVTDRYIDLVVMTHPQADHFNGLIDVVKRYQVGAFITNGRNGTAKSFASLQEALQEKNIPALTLQEGDAIAYGESRFDIISPNNAFLKSKELNDTCIVMKLTSASWTALFTGDIGKNIEEYLMRKYNMDIDILKVGHHGSRFSSSPEFMRATTPRLAAIEVGARNTYGHPTAYALENLAAVGAKIVRTDKDGTIKVVLGKEGIKVLKKK